MSTFLATPHSWFDLPVRVAAAAESGQVVDLTLNDSEGRRPLGDVALDELQALHYTFGSWWHTLGGDRRPASLRAGDYDQFLAASRRLLTEKAEAVLASPIGSRGPAAVRVTFPDLDHALLADPRDALLFFRSFLDVLHSPSLVAWARTASGGAASAASAATRAWFRVLLQKVSVEDELAEAIDCLRSVYADDGVRDELVKEERRLLEDCRLGHMHGWGRALGLDRCARQEPPIRPSRPGAALSGEPDVTVLVPSHCHEAFIEATLQSVLAQTHGAFRLLVVDDCSSDRTLERASRIGDPRIQIDVNERNLGLGDTVLRAVDGITTPYVALLNSDDLFRPRRLERCIAVLRNDARVQVVATGVAPIDAAGRQLAPANVRRLFDGSSVAEWIQWFFGAGQVSEGSNLLLELLEHNLLVTSSNIVCRTEYLRGRRDMLRGLKYCLDWQLFLDAAIDGALAYVPEELVEYRLHASNTMWFDAARRAVYAVEVNRVLASALRRLFDPSSVSRRDPTQFAAILDRVTSRAMKHSHANAFLLYAIELLGAAAVEQAASRSDAVRKSLQPLLQPNAMASDPGLGAASTAARVLAAAWREEATVARGGEEWARAQLNTAEQGFRQAQEEVARLRSSAEWLVGDMLWNRAGLSHVGLPVARGRRWLRRRRDG